MAREGILRRVSGRYHMRAPIKLSSCGGPRQDCHHSAWDGQPTRTPDTLSFGRYRSHPQSSPFLPSPAGVRHPALASLPPPAGFLYLQTFRRVVLRVLAGYARPAMRS
eukprot:scaffold3100_cov403-Prasinococcus_capsulatus_cf.AAC.9